MIDDDPLFPEPDGASDGRVIPVVDAAYAQWVIGLVFRAVRDPVIEGTEAMLPVAPRFRRVVIRGESEYFRERVCWHTVFLPTAAEVYRSIGQSIHPFIC